MVGEPRRRAQPPVAGGRYDRPDRNRRREWQVRPDPTKGGRVLDRMASAVHPDRVLKSLDRVLTEVEALVRAVRPDQLGAPTPCTRWRVHDLLNHLVLVNLVYVAKIEERPAPDESADVLGDDPAGAFRASADLARVAFSRPGVLDLPCALPWGSVPGYVIVQHVVNELVVHGWDLAKATRQSTDLVPDIAAEALAAWRAWLGGRPRHDGGMFAPPRPAPVNACAADRLAAYLGREL
jgi:uncharacterized protein (TIGR03086 family)